MHFRSSLLVAALLLLPAGNAARSGDASHWQATDILAFTDFDDLEVRLDGKKCKAFLVGLRPLRASAASKDEQEQMRKTVLAKLRKNALSGRIVIRRGEVVGLSLDTFMHHKNDFAHPWDPNEYLCCWSGWAAYNLNTYFLQMKMARFHDNFGTNQRWRETFTDLVCKMQRVDRALVLIPQLGDVRFVRREAATRELQALGEPVLPVLKKATSSRDVEIQRRAELLIQALTHPPAQKVVQKTAWAVAGK